MKKAFTVFLLLSSFLLTNSCHKDDETSSGSSGNGMVVTVSGIVVGDNNYPLSGVTVTAYGQTTTTNVTGTFVLKNVVVNKDRAVVHFSKSGYSDGTWAFIPRAGKVNYIRIGLVYPYVASSITSSAGGTATLPDGSTVQFQPNSFVKSDNTLYTGNVYVAFNHLSPDDASFGFAVPGGDFAAKDASDKDVVLYSYGMLGVTLTGSSGEKLQLATGSTATLTMPIAASQLAASPASIALWYFDETASLWKEQGTATKVGNNYTGTVTHFSWWNCDYPGDRATIKGRVLDCNNQPLPNIVVTVNSFATITTDANGEYQNWVPAALPLTVQVLASFNNNIVANSQLENVPALSGGQTFTVPDLLISTCVSRVAGTITGCNNMPGGGVVYVSWPGGYNYVYCMTGSYSIIVPANTSVDVKLYTGNSYGNATATSGASGTVTNVGDVVLCDNSGVQPDNSFYITGGGYNNELFIIDTISSICGINNGRMDMYIYGRNMFDGRYIGLSFGLDDTIAKTYSMSQTTTNYIELQMDSIYDYRSDQPNSNARCVVSVVPPAGGTIKGTFEGVLYNVYNIPPITATITQGKFSISRVH